MKYQFIEQHKQEFPVVVMCRELGVSESGFYAWRKCPASQCQREGVHLTQEIRQVFGRHQGRYGYARKYAITLLNHVPISPCRIVRSRLPLYGSAVQEALFLAWRTLQYPCAKRLVPCLPKLILVLERDGHLQLDEEHRRQLLTMSIRTAERLLSTQRRPSPRRFSTTQPGILLISLR